MRVSDHERQTTTFKDKAMKASQISIIGNVFLSLFKLLAGVFAHSSAMISDAIHSLSDVGSTFIVIAGIHISEKPSDDDHPYGHERFECIASIILAAALAVTGAGIGYAGIQNIITKGYLTAQTPGLLAIAAAIVSIIAKEGMFQYTKKTAQEIHSDALMADAWHHRSDALSSIGAMIGIVGARAGFPVLDSVASIVICLCIFKAVADIFKEAVDKMVDKACSQETVSAIEQLILEQPGVIGIDELRTRIFGAKIYVDVEIAADGSQTLWEAHRIAENVHQCIETNIPDVKHCMVHVNPVDPNRGQRQK